MSDVYDAPFGDLGGIEYTEVGLHVEFLTGPAFDSLQFNEEGIGPRLVRGINITRGYTRWPKANTKFWAQLTPDLEKYLLEENDLLIGMDGSLVGRNFALIKKDDLPCLLVQRVARLRARTTLHYEYLYHLIASDAWLNYVDVVKTNSGIPHISNGDIKEFKVPFHSPVSQQKIATILSTVDQLIEKTQTLIDKYTAIKQGMMADLFTRGIDLSPGPDGRPESNPNYGQLRPPREQAPELYKETELGWVPKEWEVANLQNYAMPGVSHLRTGPFGSALKGEHWRDEGTPVITIGSLGEGEFIESELLYIDDYDAKRLVDFKLKTGDVVFSRVADVGRSVVVTEDQEGWVMSSNLMRISLNRNEVRPNYLQYILASDTKIKKQIRCKVNAGGREVANSDILNRILFAIPKVLEQILIIEKVESVDSRICLEKVIIEKLTRQKKGLMQDLLTGKVKV